MIVNETNNLKAEEMYISACNKILIYSTSKILAVAC